jgi:hypothetical protein
MLYLANVIVAMNAGSSEDSEQAWQRANRILFDLFGPQTEKPPTKVSDLLM